MQITDTVAPTPAGTPETGWAVCRCLVQSLPGGREFSVITTASPGKLQET